MWTSLLQWAQQVLAMAVLFALGSLLMPEGSLRGTVRAVMGLALLAAVVGPVVGLVEDAGVWGQAAARWLPAVESPAPPQGLPLVREGVEEGMQRRALQLGAASLEAALRQVVDGAGYEVVALGWQLQQGQAPVLELRVRRRSQTAVEPERLPAYVAALTGLEGPEALRLQVEP